VKLHAAGPSTYNTITGYGEGYVMVNNRRHDSSVIVMPDQVVPWNVSEFSGITLADFEKLKTLNAEILLLGTGPQQRFPHPSLTAPLAAAGIGVEVMDLKAACRTYNILAAEERRVAAALLFR
jgi:uncharacterized protein